MFSLTLKYDNDSIKYKICMEMRNWDHFSNVDRNFLDFPGKSVTHFNYINKCSFDFLNQFNYWWNQLNSHALGLDQIMCVSVCECASVSVIDSTNWFMGRKNKYSCIVIYFCLEIWILAWRSHGKIMEDFCGNPDTIQKRTLIEDLHHVNSLWPSDPIWWHRSGLALIHVMAFCLIELSLYLN